MPRTNPLDQDLQTSLTPALALPTWGSWSSLRGQAQGASGARHRGQKRPQGQEQRGGSACKKACQEFRAVLAPPRFGLGRDSHDRREPAPSHRDTVGLGQGLAGEGSMRRGSAWKEWWGLCLWPSTLPPGWPPDLPFNKWSTDYMPGTVGSALQMNSCNPIFKTMP